MDNETTTGSSAQGPSSEDMAAARAFLEQCDPRECFESVARLARSNQTGVLTGMDYSPRYTSHDPTCVTVPPDKPSLDAIRLYARAAYRDFDANLGAAFKTSRVTGTLTEVHNRLIHDNDNVAVITNHGDIIDIALVLAALNLAMCDDERTYGSFGETLSVDELAQRSNIMVSRMVCTRAAFDIPAIDVLRVLCHTFLSVPQTHTRRRARIDPEYIRANNLVMRTALDERMSGGGQLLAMAASGSQDISAAAGLWRRVRALRAARHEEIPDAPSTHLQPLYAGTIRLMTSCRYVLPVATSMDADHSICEIGELTRVRDEDDCHGVMEWIAKAHQDATGVTTVYHAQEDDRLTQLRESLAKRRNLGDGDSPPEALADEALFEYADTGEPGHP